jgi:hypothetical protein
LDFDEIIGGPAIGGDEYFPVRGEKKQRIGWEAFYKQVQRPDLATRVSDRWWTKTVLTTAGVLGLLGSTVGITAAGWFALTSGDPLGSVTQNPWPFYFSLGGYVASVVMMHVSGTIQWMPVEMPINRRLAHDYNVKLARGEIQARVGAIPLGVTLSLPMP